MLRNISFSHSYEKNVCASGCLEVLQRSLRLAVDSTKVKDMRVFILRKKSQLFTLTDKGPESCIVAQIFRPPPPTHPPTPIPSPGAVTLAFPLSSSELQSLSSPLPVRVNMSESSQLFILQSMPPPQGLSPLHLFAREPCLLCESGWSKGFAMGMVTIVGKKV